MRILIHKAVEGVHRVTLVPSRRSHLPPVQLSGRSKNDVKEGVAKALEDMRAQAE